MAYQATTFTNMHNLLEKIKDFLFTNGWTINLWTDDITEIWSRVEFDYSGGKRLHVQKTAADSTVMYFNLRSVTKGVIFSNYSSSTQTQNGRLYNEQRGLGINGSTGYNVSNDWDKQPGAPVAGLTSESIGSVMTEVPASGTNNCFFFQNDDTVVIVVELDTGYYGWMAFGCLEKAGTYTGGVFYSSSITNYYTSYYYWYLSGSYRGGQRASFFGFQTNDMGNGGVYHNADSDPDWYHSGYEGNQAAEKEQCINFGGHCPYEDLYQLHSNHLSALVYTRTPNAFNGLSVMIPLYVYTKRANGRWSYLGRPSGLRAINISMYSAADEFSIEGDTWKVFPAHTKAEAGTTNLNGNVGFAVKKI